MVMEKAPQAILFLLLTTVHLGIAQNTNINGENEVHVGVILDLGSLVGKIAKTSILLAMEDFYAMHPNYTTKVVMHIKDSVGSSVQAATAGKCFVVYHESNHTVFFHFLPTALHYLVCTNFQNITFDVNIC